ncbi:hypothetical protein FRC12_007468 [Ceratobasidium sp. 428]|nr:hypothetical protein FRC12_007468 [Ceratobasidium sp. 428]
MATITSVQCEVALTKEGDLSHVKVINNPLQATFGVPKHEAAETCLGVLLYNDPGSLSKERQYTIRSGNGQAVVNIGPATDMEQGVVATAQGVTSSSIHEGTGSWFYFGV